MLVFPSFIVFRFCSRRGLFAYAYPHCSTFNHYGCQCFITHSSPHSLCSPSKSKRITRARQLDWDGNQTYLLQLTDKHNNTLFIQLSRDGSYWNINSAGIFKEKYSRRKPEVDTRPALEPGTTADSSGVNNGETGAEPSPAGNSPTTSDGKGTENSETMD